jgi:hypothetical protein
LSDKYRLSLAAAILMRVWAVGWVGSVNLLELELGI